MKKGLFYYMLIACLCACQKKTETISTASLLKEMVDCEALAKYPEPYYETRQFSSYDRASVKKIVSLGMPIVTEASFCALIPLTDGESLFWLIRTVRELSLAFG